MQLSVSIDGIDQALKRINEAVAAFDRGEVLETVGAILESQTRRRITDEKESPEGQRWADWSPAYAETRKSNHSLLEDKGGLLDSIQPDVQGDSVEVGSNLVYAAAHQMGLEMSIMSTGRHIKIPARPYLGLSKDNEDEIVSVVNDWLAEKMK